jgi:hypothetical protein
VLSSDSTSDRNPLPSSALETLSIYCDSSSANSENDPSMRRVFERPGIVARVRSYEFAMKGSLVELELMSVAVRNKIFAKSWRYFRPHFKFCSEAVTANPLEGMQREDNSCEFKSENDKT